MAFPAIMAAAAKAAPAALPGLLGGAQMGPPAPAPQMGPPTGLMGGPQPGFDLTPGFEGFFKNMDSTLQSPSKLIGLGLLNQLAPGAGLVGLLGSGFYNG